ncbi:hypothetical protein [Sulfoacidibacillus thermotolerans]|uniref:Uncharacterized protein n=1 Tax=Sulfoacidibacillus thermotolerans TaxID=1765684 RepID=A0A2U3DA19_SULT2|nr:hypothetical protein [Sulfoacidibacillus thermotolerans]PWI58115.1 hypothetical protein BM613_05485 [Sulfoacidibacillus thermotolerans]
MNPSTDYQAAPLSAQTLSTLKNMEQDLSAQEGQSIILVAYTRNSSSTRTDSSTPSAPSH